MILAAAGKGTKVTGPAVASRDDFRPIRHRGGTFLPRCNTPAKLLERPLRRDFGWSRWASFRAVHPGRARGEFNDRSWSRHPRAPRRRVSLGPRACGRAPKADRGGDD